MLQGRIVVLSGAGLSAESGLGTFRDADGIWSQYDLSEVATPEGFARDPAKVHGFYNARRRNLAEAVPNAAHAALARLEAETGAVIVTQNVDNLLEQAGVRSVVHMHGRLMRARCADCKATWDAPLVMSPDDLCPDCGKAATRPDIVWFGEMPQHLDRIEEAIESAALFAAIGTSGQVYPAAAFVEDARRAGARCIELNLEETAISRAFHEHRYGPASEIVPAWVSQVLAG